MILPHQWRGIANELPAMFLDTRWMATKYIIAACSRLYPNVMEGNFFERRKPHPVPR
jgi:hypothetical protein